MWILINMCFFVQHHEKVSLFFIIIFSGIQAAAKLEYAFVNSAKLKISMKRIVHDENDNVYAIHHFISRRVTFISWRAFNLFSVLHIITTRYKHLSCTTPDSFQLYNALERLWHFVICYFCFYFFLQIFSSAKHEHVMLWCRQTDGTMVIKKRRTSHG